MTKSNSEWDEVKRKSNEICNICGEVRAEHTSNKSLKAASFGCDNFVLKDMTNKPESWEEESNKTTAGLFLEMQQAFDVGFKAGRMEGKSYQTFNELKSELEHTNQIRSQTLTTLGEKIEIMRKDKVDFGKNPDMSMPYNLQLAGFDMALQEVLNLINQEK